MYKRSLTTQEAEKIVSLVESILTKPKLRYGYKLSELDGYSRIDVGHAFNLMIAKIYKNLGTNARENNDLNVFINAMDTSLVSIAQLGIPDFEIDNLEGKEDLNNLIRLTGKWSLISLGDNSKTEITSLKSERIAYGELEAPSSFAEFCYLLLKSDSQNYWEKVYNHIGLEYHGNSKNSPIQTTVKKNAEEELKRKYEEEFRRREEEIIRNYQARENKLKEESERINKGPQKKSNGSLITVLIVIILIGSFVFYQFYQQNKQREEEFRIAQEKAVEDSIKAAENAEIIHQRFIQDSTDAALKKFRDAIAEVEASMNEESSTYIASPELTQEQLEKYYRDGKNDENIQLLRKKIDQYIAGELEVGDQIDQTALDTMNYFGREYLDSKFFLATIENGKYGGKWMQIVFINKPDKVFFAWVLHYRLAGFGDAQWNEKGIRMVQNDKQMLNPAYGF